MAQRDLDPFAEAAIRLSSTHPGTPMPYNKQFDAYIAKSPDWAQPILTSLRATVHEVCPDVDEELKWSSPAFTYHGITMGWFKEYATFHFWKGELVTGTALGAGGMGAVGSSAA